jgi:hypothetical protein
MQLQEKAQRAERVSLQLVVKVIAGGQAYRAEMVNLSLTGAFLEASFPLGSRLQVYLPIPGGDPMILTAKVIREGWSQKFLDRPRVDNLAVRALGIGVQFGDMEDPDAQRLQDFLDLVLDRS